ncbi:MAG: hypothetical protein ABI333_22280 [bacterium]
MNRVCLLFVLIVGCQPTSEVRERPRDRSAGGSSEGAIQEINRVYRVARFVRAQKVGEPQKVTLAGGVVATRVLLQQTRWVLLRGQQSAIKSLARRAELMRLAEAERLKHMRRVDNFAQLWWVAKSASARAGGDLKTALKPTDKPHTQHRELVFLGRDDRVAWYAYAPIPAWVRIQKKLALQGGDLPIPALVRGLSVKDPHETTALDCYYLLREAGPTAMAEVDKAIAAKSDSRYRAVRAVGRQADPRVTAWLMRLVESADKVVVSAAHKALCVLPRKEAAALYVKWLAEGAGRRDVTLELSAVDQVGATQAAASLPKVLASPHRVLEYRQAFELSRKLAGKPLPEQLLKTEQQLQQDGFAGGERRPDKDRIEYGVLKVVQSPDAEAAAVVGLSLALFVSKGNYEATRKAGVTILKKLKRGRGRKLVGRLAKACRSAADREALQRVLAAMK